MTSVTAGFCFFFCYCMKAFKMVDIQSCCEMGSHINHLLSHPGGPPIAEFLLHCNAVKHVMIIKWNMKRLMFIIPDIFISLYTAAYWYLPTIAYGKILLQIELWISKQHESVESWLLNCKLKSNHPFFESQISNWVWNQVWFPLAYISF